MVYYLAFILYQTHLTSHLNFVGSKCNRESLTSTDAPFFPENIFHTKQKSDHIFGGHEQFVFYINFANTTVEDYSV